MTIEHTDGEKKAYEAILEAMRSIQSIDGQLLEYNHEELAEAIHNLQLFVHQHVLHRLDPDYYSAWWEDPLPEFKNLTDLVLMRHEQK
jgi:hypothetical protein